MLLSLTQLVIDDFIKDFWKIILHQTTPMPLLYLCFYLALPIFYYENLWICLIGPEPMDIATTSAAQSCEIPNSDVTILEGHTSEV